MAPDLAGAARELLVRLRSAGLQAAVTPADLNPPGVFVSLSEVKRRFGGCSDVVWNLYLVSPDQGRAEALETLTSVLASFDNVVQVSTLRPVDLITPAGSLPALSVTYTERLSA